MSFRLIVEGEQKLLAVLGANATLSGAHALTWEKAMPTLNGILTVSQILVAGVTIVYLAVKLKKLLSKS